MFCRQVEPNERNCMRAAYKLLADKIMTVPKAEVSANDPFDVTPSGEVLGIRRRIHAVDQEER